MWKTAICLGLLASVGYFLFGTAIRFGVFRHFHQHRPGPCRKLNPEDVYGSEDFSMTSAGLVFITSGLAMGASPVTQFVQDNKIKGRILLLDLSKPGSQVVDLKIQPSSTFDYTEFRPHGISVLEDRQKREHLLYVVSHPVGQPDRIEKMRYLPESGVLRHERTFLWDKFNILNDLAVVSEDVFYVTNFLYFKNALLGLVEQLLNLSLGEILHFDGKHYTAVVTGLNVPNGVTLSADKKYLYVALTQDGYVRSYSVDPKDASLTLLQNLDLHTSADNFHLSQAGDALYTGSHPIIHKVFSHFSEPKTLPAPAQVLRLPLKQGLIQEEEITELFYDHGELISGSSIATVYNKQLLIGSVIHNLAICDLTGPTEV